jgi:hypothetical protein
MWGMWLRCMGLVGGESEYFAGYLQRDELRLCLADDP